MVASVDFGGIGVGGVSDNYFVLVVLLVITSLC